MILRRVKRLFGTGSDHGPADIRPLEPGMEVVYAVGDIHGRYDLLCDIESLIEADHATDRRDATVIYLGDFIDRGPQAADVLDHFSRRAQPDIPRIVLRGNHEAMMVDVLHDPARLSGWFHNGGGATLASYGIAERPETLRAMPSRHLKALLDTNIPAKHLRFLETLPDAIDTADHFFCHAGVDPHKPLSDQTRYDLLWSREPFLSHTGGFEKIIVHGHTPVPEAELKDGRLSIDTYACETGRLTAAKLDLTTGSINMLFTNNITQK